MSGFRVAFVSAATTTYKDFQTKADAEAAAKSAIQDPYTRVAAVWGENGELLSVHSDTRR